MSRKNLKWTQRMKDYIEACYRGTERGASGRPRRWFSWEGGHEGDVNEFVLHLEEKFGVNLSTYARDRVHGILRDRGYQLFHAPHPSPTPSTKGRIRERAEEAEERAEEAEEGTKAQLTKIAPMLSEAAGVVFRVAVALETLGDKVGALEKTLTHLQKEVDDLSPTRSAE